MTAYTSHVEEVRALRSTRERVAQLLSRYPHVSKEDRREILTFIQEGRHLDVGLLTANDKLRPKIDAFMADHRSDLGLKWAEVALVVGSVLALLVIAWLLGEVVA